MFFVKAGHVLAHLVFWLSVLRLGVAGLIAFGTPTMAENAAASRRYLAAATSGEAINQAFVGILVAVVVGILATIGSHTEEQAYEDLPDSDE